MESKLAGKGKTKKPISKGGVMHSKGDEESRSDSDNGEDNIKMELQHRVDELQMLYEMSLAIGILKDPREIADAIVDTLTSRMNWHHITIRHYDPKLDQLKLLSFAQPGIKNEKERQKVEKLFNELISKPGQGLSGWVFQHGVSVRSGDVQNDPRYIITYPELKSGLYVPIRAGEHVIGVIAVESQKANAFDESDERLLDTIALHAAVVIENSELIANAHAELEQRIEVENSLRESERKYRLLAENISDVIWVLDLETFRFNYVSPSIKYLRGYSAEEVLQQTMEMSVTPASFAYIQQILPERIQLFNKGVIRSYTDDFEHPCKDGSVVWSETTTSFHINKETGHIEVYGVSHNVTERKDAEEKLKQSNEMYRLLAENSSDGVTLISGDGMVLYISPAYLRILGYTDADVVGIDITEILKRIHPEDRAKIQEEILRGHNEKLPVSQYEFRVSRKNGDYIWIEDMVRREFDENGNVSRVIVNSRDATERKVSEEQLRESEERYRLLLEASMDAIFLTAPDGQIFRANKAACDLLQYREEEIIKGGRDLILDYSDSRLNIALEVRRRTGRYKGELTFIRKDGTRFPGEVSTTVFIDRHGQERSSMIVRDISERKKSERALQENEQKFRSIFERSPIGMGLIDSVTGNFLQVNSKYCEIVGRTSREMLSTDFSTITHPDDIGIDDHERRRLISGELSSYNLEKRYIRPDGSVVWAYLTVVAMWQNDDERKVHLTMVEDVTESKLAEEKLKQSEALYRTVISVLSEGLVVQDTQDKILMANESAARILGLTMNQLMGKDSYDPRWRAMHEDGSSFLPEDHPSMVTLRTGKPVDGMLMTVDTGDGNRKVISINSRPLRNEEEGVTGVVVSFSDITQRKQSEKALRTSEESLKEAQRLAHIGSWEWTIANEKIIWSEELYRIVGIDQQRTPSSFEGLSSFYTPESWERLRNAATKALEDKKAFALELELIRADGQQKHVFARGEVNQDASGNVIGLHGTLQDISKRKQTEYELARSRDQFQRLVSQIPIGIQVFDTRGVCVDVNEAHTRFFGVTRDHLIGKYNIFQDPLAEKVGTSEAARRALRGETIVLSDQSFDFSHADPRYASGTQLVLNVTIFPVFDSNGEIINIVGLNEDISDRKKAEQLIEDQLKRLDALRTIEIAIKSSFDLSSTLEILVEQVTSQLNVDAASVLLFNKNTLTLDHAASRGFVSAAKHTPLPPSEGYAGKILLERQIVHVPNLHKVSNKRTGSLPRQGESFAGYVGVPLIAKGQIVGVLEIFQHRELNPSPDWFDFLELLSDEAAIAIDNAQLFESLQRSNFELTLAYDATIEGWSRALDLRDKETEGHTQRVTSLTVKLAQRMGIPDVDIIHIRRGALLHDIGKMGIPDKILLKAASLTDEEWSIMRKHTLYARDMLSPISYLRPALEIPLYHHEKWDGSGYPYNMKGTQIPLAARIFAVVDVWDALTSARPYREAWSEEKAFEFIKSESGKHFDPQVVDAFLDMIGQGWGN